MRWKAGALLLKLVDQVEHVTGRAAEPVELDHHKFVARTNELKNRHTIQEKRSDWH
jgi:hypothetical protein